MNDTKHSIRPLVDRRGVLGGLVGAPSLLASGRAQGALGPLSGTALYRSVRQYDMLGEHRTASACDDATSNWLASRLAHAGFDIRTPAFPFPLVEPRTCAIEVNGSKSFALFPSWPVIETADAGLRAALAADDAADLHGRIVITALPYRMAGNLLAPGVGDHVLDLVRRGAAAVVAATDGPTGEIMALNAAPDRLNWSIPVALAAGRDAAALQRAALAGTTASLTLTGHRDRHTSATNVIAHRPGKGKTLVVSTPKSGWFHCAGERGSGLAIFLGLAEHLARSSDASLCFIATSGHEFQGLGGQAILGNAPPPEAVGLWVHLGANVACNDVIISNGVVTPLQYPQARRGILASAELHNAVARAFAGQIGYYKPPVDVHSQRAVGEVKVFRAAGFRPLLALVGAHALFHTKLDRAAVATSPVMLAPVAKALASLIKTLSF